MTGRPYTPPPPLALLDHNDSKQVAQAIDVLENAFGERMLRQHWEWKFQDAPAGTASNLVLLDETGRIVGHWASTPVRYKIGPRCAVAHLSTDIAVDRRRFGRREAAMKMVLLGKEILRLIDAKYAAFGLGYPNTNSLFLGIKRLGWNPLLHIQQLAYYLRFAPFVAKKTSNRLLPHLTDVFGRPLLRLALIIRSADLWPAWGQSIKKIDSFDHRADDLWRRVSSTIGNAIIRDARYLNWRYCSPKRPLYHVFAALKKSNLVGFVAIGIKTDPNNLKEALILDLLAQDHSQIITARLLLAALKFALKNRCHVLRAWTLKHSPYFRHLRAAGFIKRKSLAYLCLRPCTPNPNLARQIMNPSAWHVTMGDSDFF